jgi:gamma-glutamyltranspeptidase/glutathione hydrolase
MGKPRWSHRLIVLTTGVLAAWAAAASPAAAHGTWPPGPSEPTALGPTAVGWGGAVATVDPTATQVGLDVLRSGGNAVDAAVAAAATLGVTEPFSAGIGGGGFFVYYDARSHRVSTIDGREAAPASMGPDAFIDPATGTPFTFDEGRVSGISVGVPGTPATWETAARQWGSRPLGALLRPAIRVAEDGFPVDDVFRRQIADNANIFGQFGSTSALYLPGGAPPATGTTFRNPDLGATYRIMAEQGNDGFYRGPVAADLVATVQHPPLATTPVGTWAHPIRPGGMTEADLASYRTRTPLPTWSRYRGVDVFGMATPSSGGTAVGEALDILERSDMAGLPRAQALHRYLEASSLAFADRNRYVGDDTPRRLLNELTDDRFAAERACLINPDAALPKPVAPGVPDGRYERCATAAPTAAAPDHEQSTTNLTVADRWGNVVEYTFTIEQIGGSGMVVPGRGFLLNNELTDFNFTPTQGDAPDPNLPAPGKRPRSSMSPTIVLWHGLPWLALGTPGGSTIITTVLQTLVNRIDFGMDLPAAVAAPRATPRNGSPIQAEPAFLAAPEAAELTALGHTFSSTAEIGSATAIEFRPGFQIVAAAEPVRRGGGAAGVVYPARS